MDIWRRAWCGKLHQHSNGISAGPGRGEEGVRVSCVLVLVPEIESSPCRPRSTQPSFAALPSPRERPPRDRWASINCSINSTKLHSALSRSATIGHHHLLRHAPIATRPYLEQILRPDTRPQWAATTSRPNECTTTPPNSSSKNASPPLHPGTTPSDPSRPLNASSAPLSNDHRSPAQNHPAAGRSHACSNRSSYTTRRTDCDGSTSTTTLGSSRDRA